MIKEISKEGCISAYDRVALYGDGCFTTIRVESGVSLLLPAHIQRLKLAAQRLFIDFKQWTQLQERICLLANNMSQGVIKVVLSRGEGNRGYGTQEVSPPNCFLYQSKIPAHYSHWQSNGIGVNVSPIQLAKQPLLAGIKHLNRLEQVLIKRELELQDCDDCLVCDTDGNVVESSAGNVFWRHNDQWYTPDLSSCGVEGVMRNHIANHLNSLNIKVNVEVCKPDSLLAADEVFICNCLMKWLPVVALNVNQDVKKWHRKSLTVDRLLMGLPC